MYYTSKKIEYTDDTLECIINEPEFIGWRVLYKKEDLGEEFQGDDDIEQLDIKTVKKLVKEPRPDLEYITATSRQTYDRAICRYTQASLIKELESKGIGRPATFASIMDKIIKREYVITRDFPGKEYSVKTLILNKRGDINTKSSKTMIGKESKKLTITPLGESVINWLVSKFDNIFNYDFTRYIENELDHIYSGKSTYYQVVDKVYKTFHPRVVELKLQRREVAGISNATSLGELEMEGYPVADIYLKNGKFGYYLEYNKETFSLQYIDKQLVKRIIDDHDLDAAADAIESVISYRAKKAERQKEFDSKKIKIGKYELLPGPHGYWFEHNKKKYGIGDRDPETLDENIIKDIVKQKQEWLKQRAITEKPKSTKTSLINSLVDDKTPKKRGKSSKK